MATTSDTTDEPTNHYNPARIHVDGINGPEMVDAYHHVRGDNWTLLYTDDADATADMQVPNERIGAIYPPEDEL